MSDERIFKRNQKTIHSQSSHTTTKNGHTQTQSEGMRKMSKKGNVNEMNDDDDDEKEEEEKDFSRRDKLFMLINLCICCIVIKKNF